MKKALRILLVVSIFISFYLFLRATDIGESIRLVKHLGINALWIVLCTFGAYLAGTSGWKYCIDSDVKLPFVQLFMFRHIGNTIALFNPTSAIAGEMFNANRLIREGVDGQVAYKSVLLSRIMMTLSQLIILLLVFGWFLLFLSGNLPDTFKYAFWGCLELFMVVISVLLYLLLKEGDEVQSVRSDKKWRRFLHRVEEMRVSLAEYIRRRPRKAILALFFFTVQWILASLELFFILGFLGFDVMIWDGLFLDTVIIVSKSAFWFIPGQLGAEELINKFALYLIGISSLNIWLSVSMLRRIRLLFWSAVAGIFYMGLGKTKKVALVGSKENQAARVDLKPLFADMFPKKKIPRFVIRFLEKLIAVDKINKLFASAPGKKNTEFTDACMQYLDVTCKVVGEDNLPSGDSKLIFASNHPQGGIEAICIASVLGRKYGNSIKFHANEILCYLEPLSELFVPIRRKQKRKENAYTINDFYKTDNHIIVFPAGVTASKTKGKIIDHEWHKSFITKAVQNRRDVVPLYFQAQNSDLFYFVENFRRFIRSRINFDVILFGHEFFKQMGKTLTLYIGKPVSWETFDKTHSHREWADKMRDIVCGLPLSLTDTIKKSPDMSK